MAYVTVAHIVKVFGLDGTLKARSSSDFRALRYQIGGVLYLVDPTGTKRLSVHVQAYRPSGEYDFVTFEEIQGITAAERYVGYEIQADKGEHSPQKGTYYHADLEGCSVYDEKAVLLGVVSTVEDYPAQKVLRVRRDNGKDILVPFVKTFIKKVDIDHRRIDIRVIEGML